MSSSPPERCPDCGQSSVRRRFTWRGLLAAILCFPCGIWCCLRRYTRMQCSRCGCDIIARSAQIKEQERQAFRNHGYHFKEYDATKLAPAKVRELRSQAMSTVSSSSVSSRNSAAPLIQATPAIITNQPLPSLS